MRSGYRRPSFSARTRCSASPNASRAPGSEKSVAGSFTNGAIASAIATNDIVRGLLTLEMSHKVVPTPANEIRIVGAAVRTIGQNQQIEILVGFDEGID